jgi:hypothetical protein
MGATVNNSSGFSVIGKPEEIKRISRRIRPFRHAYIKLIKPASTLTWEYVNNINEFGDTFITQVSDGTGSYGITFDVGFFKNPTNVIQDVSIIHSTTSNIVITASFTNDTKSNLNINVFDITLSSTTDVLGEILVVIREFYE